MGVIGSRLGADAAYMSGIAVALVDEPLPWISQLTIRSDVLCTQQIKSWREKRGNVSRWETQVRASLVGVLTTTTMWGDRHPHFLPLSLQVALISCTDKRYCVVSVWVYLWVYRQSPAPTVVPRASVIRRPFKGPTSDDPRRFPISVGRLGNVAFCSS